MAQLLALAGVSEGRIHGALPCSLSGVTGVFSCRESLRISETLRCRLQGERMGGGSKSDMYRYISMHLQVLACGTFVFYRLVYIYI